MDIKRKYNGHLNNLVFRIQNGGEYSNRPSTAPPSDLPVKPHSTANKGDCICATTRIDKRTYSDFRRSLRSSLYRPIPKCQFCPEKESEGSGTGGGPAVQNIVSFDQSQPTPPSSPSKVEISNMDISNNNNAEAPLRSTDTHVPIDTLLPLAQRHEAFARYTRQQHKLRFQHHCLSTEVQRQELREFNKAAAAAADMCEQELLAAKALGVDVAARLRRGQPSETSSRCTSLSGIIESVLTSFMGVKFGTRRILAPSADQFNHSAQYALAHKFRSAFGRMTRELVERANKKAQSENKDEGGRSNAGSK